VSFDFALQLVDVVVESLSSLVVYFADERQLIDVLT
jgi:hypothetical protein